MSYNRRVKRANQRYNEKQFSWLKGRNIGKDYIDIKLNLSELDDKHKALLIKYVKIRCALSPEYKEYILKLDKSIKEAKEKFELDESTNNS